MKNKLLLTAALIGMATLSAHAGFNFGISLVVPSVVVAAPVAPVDVAPAMVPDSYVWDGNECVGLVGDQYFYLGPGNVWLACDPYRLDRFHGWERDHRDWRYHAIHNDHFRHGAYNRNDDRGHLQPVVHRGPEKAPTKAAAPRNNKK